MTHDELLARIAKLSVTPETNVVPSELATALMVVVKLHGEVDGGCRICRDDYWAEDYPCKTIEAIEKELSNG